MKTAIVFGVTFAAGAMFFACAKGDEGGAADGGGVDVTDDASNGDGSEDGNISYVNDGAASGDGAIGDGGADADGAITPVCVESDAGCSTGSPGACSDGILHCSDAGVAVCEPIATTEPCYSGSVTTANKGICHDGTQTCTGTLGACVGEVDPMSHEDCFNNTDDDCNGLINDGCPTSLSLTSEHTVTGAGGNGGGNNPVHCPAGAFITHVDSIFDDSDEEAAGVSIYCATPTLTQQSATMTYTVTLAANTPAPYATAEGSDAVNDVRHDDCGIAGLIGIANSVGLAKTTGGHTYVGGLGHHCATSSVAFDASTNHITFDFVRDGNTSFNDWTDSTGTTFNIGCASTEVMVGIDVHDGLWMDNIAPICATLTVNYGAGTPDP